MIARRKAMSLGWNALVGGTLPGWSLPGAGAATLPFPPEHPALVVSGLIGRDGEAPERAFSMAELEALGAASIVTTTPWTRGPQHFTGVPLKRVLDAVECRGALLYAVAMNDYRTEIPVADAEASGALLATRLDGKPMRVRDFGPIWIVYPWSERPDLDRPAVHRRSIWQLARIEVR